MLQQRFMSNYKKNSKQLLAWYLIGDRFSGSKGVGVLTPTLAVNPSVSHQEWTSVTKITLVTLYGKKRVTRKACVR